ASRPDDERRSAKPSYYLLADAEPRDAELLRQRAGLGGDPVAQILGLEHDGLAAVRKDLADQPFLAADRDVGDGAAVLPRLGSALERPAAHLGGVEDPSRARAAEPRRLEARARVELLLRQLRRAHPVEAEGANGVARP